MSSYPKSEEVEAGEITADGKLYRKPDNNRKRTADELYDRPVENDPFAEYERLSRKRRDSSTDAKRYRHRRSSRSPARYHSPSSRRRSPYRRSRSPKRSRSPRYSPSRRRSPSFSRRRYSRDYERPRREASSQRPKSPSKHETVTDTTQPAVTKHTQR